MKKAVPITNLPSIMSSLLY